MSLPVLIGFAGVLVAAVATGLLAGRCVRQPRIDVAVWTAATLALTVALAAQAKGFASGFGSATFRAVQIFELLFAPLWLAWGLVELVARGERARFAMRLTSGALTAVGGVILATDPLTAQPFGKSWPSAGLHYQPVSHDVLDLVQLLAVVTAVASVGLVAARARRDQWWLGTRTGAALVGLAVLITVGLRFSLPARSAYPLLAMMAAALVWFGVTRLRDLPGRAVGRGHGHGHGRRSDARAPLGARRSMVPAREDASGRADAPDWYGDGAGLGGLDANGRPDGRPLAAHEASAAPPPGAAGAAGVTAAAAALAGPEAVPAAKPTRPYGRLVIFTLLEDRVADFDRLAEQTAEDVMTGEPDTLVYVIHQVPNAPMQRIFYEIYRDRAAFDAHESQSYVQRFVAERRSSVLATNVIELRLKIAKVAPLSNPQSPTSALAAQPGTSVQLASRQPAALPPVPAGQSGAWSTGQVQTLEPLPPGPDRRRVPSAGRRYDGP